MLVSLTAPTHQLMANGSSIRRSTVVIGARPSLWLAMNSWSFGAVLVKVTASVSLGMVQRKKAPGVVAAIITGGSTHIIMGVPTHIDIGRPTHIITSVPTHIDIGRTTPTIIGILTRNLGPTGIDGGAAGDSLL